MTDSDFEKYQKGISIKSKMNKLFLLRDRIVFAQNKENWSDRYCTPVEVKLKDRVLEIGSSDVTDKYLPKMLDDYLAKVNEEIGSLQRQFSDL
jgi:hypothetical protein